MTYQVPVVSVETCFWKCDYKAGTNTGRHCKWGGHCTRHCTWYVGGYCRRKKTLLSL